MSAKKQINLLSITSSDSQSSVSAGTSSYVPESFDVLEGRPDDDELSAYFSNQLLTEEQANLDLDEESRDSFISLKP